MSSPRSIRFEDSTLDRLAAFASRQPGVTSAAAAARFVEEGLRMDAHPGIYFVSGAAGRRASLVGGPDVWEVIRAIQDCRAANPRLKGGHVLDLVATNTGLPAARIAVALDYYTAFPDEVDERIAQEGALESELAAALDQRKSLLGA